MKSLKGTFPVALVAVAVLAGFPAAAHADVWTFSKIVDTSTPIPGGTGDFTGFGAPSYNNGFITFPGNGSSSQQGIYLASQGNPLAVVANTNTAVPGSSGNFTGFERPDVDGSGNVAFVATGGAVQQGVYAKPFGSSLNVVADRTTATPNFAGGTFNNFTNLGSASISQGVVAFAGFSQNTSGGVNQGIYTATDAGGSLARVVDRTIALPYGGSSQTMIFIDRPTIDNGNVIFSASTGTAGQNGIYELKNGVLTRIIDNTQNLPNGAGLFHLEGTVSRGPQVSGAQTQFFSFGSQTAPIGGYYGTNSSGNLITLVNLTTVPPGDTVPFTSLDYLSLSGSAFVFWGASSQEPGAFFYKTMDGSIFQRIIGDGDTLDGKRVSSLLGGLYAFDPGTFAFDVSFSDGSNGIYLGSLVPSVPEPSSLLLAGVGSIGLLGALLRRRR